MTISHASLLDHPAPDDRELGPTEDVDREPDGIPHAVIGLTALFSVVFATVMVIMLSGDETMGRVAAIVFAVVAIPLLVSRLRRKAERERDHVHPSR